MISLKYGNTNTFYITGTTGGLLIDTDYAGTLRALYRSLKQNGLRLKDISYVMATHYHPDHMGLVSELMRQDVRLLLIDAQKEYVHFADQIFSRDKLPYQTIDTASATVISCLESREFLARMGIYGEIIRTPSHSADSVSVVLDDGDCFAGDLERMEYLEAYDGSASLKSDWECILSFHPKRVFFAHGPTESMI